MMGTELLLLSAGGTCITPCPSSKARDVLAEREVLGGGPGGGPGKGTLDPTNAAVEPKLLSAPAEADLLAAGGAGRTSEGPGIYNVFRFPALLLR